MRHYNYYNAVLLLIVMLWWSMPTATAGSLYRWVDKDGKVHYSEKPPAEAPKAESKVHITNPAPSRAEESVVFEDGRDEKGNCVTMKCLADQMESDRLARERGYAQKRADNERAAAAHKKPQGGAQPSPPTALDDHLRENCKNGVYYSGNYRTNCDDIAELRRQYNSAQERAKLQYDTRQNRRY